MAKLILTQEVSGLGVPGDVVEVKDGYARNFLVPRGLATRWTKGGQKQVDQITAARRSRALSSLEDAHQARDWLAENPVSIQVRAGESGRLFGAVTTGEIADAVKEAGGPAVDKRKIELTAPIKSLGDFQVQVRLHDDVVAPIHVKVLPAKG